MTRIALEAVVEARDVLKGVVNEPPLQFSQTFSNLAGCSVYLKLECLQKNGSHKIRGAYYMFSRFPLEERERGVCTLSAGNWAQGASYAGSLLGIPVTVVMPENANPQKAEATRSYGGEVIRFGRDSNELLQKAREVARKRGAILVNPLENLDMMIGLGSLGLEILEGLPDVQSIVVPVGGGGLIGGIASAVKQEKPKVKIYGVQPEGASAMVRSLEEGRVVELDRVETIADGLAVKRPDENTFQMIQETVDDIVLVSDNEIRKTVFLTLERAKLLVEPSGAASLAAIISKRIPQLVNQKVVVLLTGGNIDLHLLAEILSSHL